MNAPAQKRFRFRDYTCRACRKPHSTSTGYCADVARAALLQQEVVAWGAVEFQDADRQLAWVAREIAAADVRLCPDCHDQEIENAGGVAVALFAGRRVA